MDTSEYLGLFLDEGRDSLRLLSAALLDLERDPGDAGTLAAIFRATHSLKGMSATVGLDAMADLAHRMEDVLTALRDAGASTTRPLIDALFACLDALEAMMDAVACGDGAEVDATAVIAGLEAAAASAPASGPAATREDGASRGSAAAPVVRIGPEHVDALVALAADLAERRARLAEIAAATGRADLDVEVERLGRSLDDLAALVGGIRLTPVEEVFMRFPRMVRDLAHTLGRLVDLRIEGGGIVLDRAVAAGLGEPLVHALRNAIDHGLEEPGERVAAGKDPVGSLVLSARTEGTRVAIEVRDDGRGMDPQALRASAVRAGRMDVATALALSDDDALQLVFLPGLSTARAITAISGRGVGMDAVRAAVEALGGEVAIASVRGEGSAVTIRFPLAQPSAPS